MSVVSTISPRYNHHNSSTKAGSSGKGSRNVSRAGRAVTTLCVSLTTLVLLSVLLNLDETQRALRTTNFRDHLASLTATSSSSSSTTIILLLDKNRTTGDQQQEEETRDVSSGELGNSNSSDISGVMKRFPRLFVNDTTVSSSGGGGYNDDDGHPPFRRNRFPTIEERLRVYMSNWYVPPCDVHADVIRYSIHQDPNYTAVHDDSSNAFDKDDFHNGKSLHLILDNIEDGNISNSSSSSRSVVNFTLSSAINVAQVMYLEPTAVQHCATHATRAQRVGPYCQDVLGLVQQTTEAPILGLFGDRTATDKIGRYAIPSFRKARSAAAVTARSVDDVNRTTATCFHSNHRPKLTTVSTSEDKDDGYQPILWKLNNNRHFGMLDKTPNYDISWQKKKNQSIWRGALTGKLSHGVSKLPPKEMCHELLRCRMVLAHANSSLVDAGLTTTADRIPDVIDGVQVTKPTVTEVELLQYKAIISLEGNDVSSGLKWNLLSNSVVLMPPPTFTSWAMEELLEPWVHYVPLLSNLTDVEEKTRWVMEHSEEAKKIAQRATLFVYDMFFHPDAKEEDEFIEKEIIRRYSAFFAEQRDQPSGSD